jgi:3-dehydroquinate dehydratase
MTLLKRELDIPVAYHATGKAGIPSRIINPLLGGQIAFCVEHYDEASDLNQIDLKTARKIVDSIRKII